MQSSLVDVRKLLCKIVKYQLENIKDIFAFLRSTVNAFECICSPQEPYYVRCIKPNEEKSPVQFNYERCQHQVMYLGLLENVRVRRAGFAFRMLYTRFISRSARHADLSSLLPGLSCTILYVFACLVLSCVVKSFFFAKVFCISFILKKSACCFVAKTAIHYRVV